jgi:hypothetical protein
MVESFGIGRSGISRHISNFYKEGELRPDSTCAKFAHVVDKDAATVRICEGLLEVKRIRSGELPAVTLDELLNEL